MVDFCLPLKRYFSRPLGRRRQEGHDSVRRLQGSWQAACSVRPAHRPIQIET